MTRIGIADALDRLARAAALGAGYAYACDAVGTGLSGGGGVFA